ncbi:MAG TPA: beta-galactosidase [Vicinamibacterales bacterium]
MFAPALRSLLIALVFAVTAAAQGPSDIRGVYVYSNDLSKLATPTANAVRSSLGIAGMDGIALVISWSAIEPSMGQYQWTTLDPWLQQAATAGKKIDLIVTGGSGTPSWLFDPQPSGGGAHSINFTISPHSGATGQCDAETIAAPWDTAFLTQWDAMLVALAAHLKSIGAYGSIALLRITGINRTTDELRLPAETAQSTGLSCVSNAITKWQNAGYKPSLLLQGWDAITSSFKKSFPDKTLSIAIIPSNAFPAIAEDGSQIKGTPPDANAPLLALAAQKFPGRLVVQFNFLMPGEAASSEVIGSAQTYGTLPAFQTNEYLGSTGQGAACSEPVTNPTPCTAQTFLALLQTGIYPLGTANPMRAMYIEVFQANANACQGDVLQAHDELTVVARRHSARH